MLLLVYCGPENSCTDVLIKFYVGKVNFFLLKSADEGDNQGHDHFQRGREGRKKEGERGNHVHGRSKQKEKK